MQSISALGSEREKRLREKARRGKIATSSMNPVFDFKVLNLPEDGRSEYRVQNTCKEKFNVIDIIFD